MQGARWVCGAALALVLAVPATADDAPRWAGTWSWMWKDGEGDTHRHVLEVEGTGEKLSARERFDDQEPVKVTDLKVAGKKINFTVIRGKRTANYSGTLDDAETINGKILVTVEGGQGSEFGWTATRVPPKDEKKK